MLIASIAKADSCDLKISLITCGTGEELYSGFGHTAIRVQRPGMDLVFNYGTFNFEEPDFYSKFVKGRLKYYLSAENWSDFLFAYQYEKRNVYEQELFLNCADKENIFIALKENIREDNKYYAYDFLKDNCTSRAANLLLKFGKIPITLQDTLPPVPTTYRKQIHETLHRDGKYWSALGIDILMGLPADEKLNKSSYPGFLPFNLMDAFNHAYVQHRKLTGPPNIILEFSSTVPAPASMPFTPLLVFTIFLGVLLPMNLSKSVAVHKMLNAFDRCLFFVLGLLGFLLLYLIFFTDHKAFALNFNLLWALPIYLVVAFSNWESTWMQFVFKSLVYWSLSLLIIWFLLPQQLNISLLPIVAWIGFRSFYQRYARQTNES